MEGVQKRRRQQVIITLSVLALIAVLVVGIYAYISNQNEFRQAIPGDVGTSPCLRPLHTHDSSGTIHIEPDDSSHPVYTIGDFFRVWGKELNSNGIFQSSQPLPAYLNVCVSGNGTYYHNHVSLTIIFKRDAPSTIVMTVNGNPEPLLQDHALPGFGNTAFESIVITYGPGVTAQF